MLEKFKDGKWVDLVSFIGFCLVVLLGVIDVTRYIALGDDLATLTMFTLYLIFALIGLIAFRSRLPYLYALNTGISIWLTFFLVNDMYPFNNAMIYSLIIVNFIVFLVGSFLAIFSHTKIKKAKPIASIVLAIIVISSLATWGIATLVSDSHQDVMREIWSVPNKYDKVECPEKGKVVEETYLTYHYATNKEESIEKRCYVYLPYDYDNSKQYNIIYLLHGTGDDEKYWLIENPYNVTMLDNLIYYGDIDPVIVVTPTWYVANDCEDDLDQLTYSFKDELRNDLMPYIETKYSTHAGIVGSENNQSFTEEFIASRDYRAFCGLSRGAVTMYHSGLCNSLDYFSYFGAFSGSRTGREYLEETLMREEYDEYDIKYLYVATGNFDIALTGQVEDYKTLLDVASLKVTENVNTNFDTFPMRYHSMGNWHLALYNFLQKAFKY